MKLWDSLPVEEDRFTRQPLNRNGGSQHQGEGFHLCPVSGPKGQVVAAHRVTQQDARQGGSLVGFSRALLICYENANKLCSHRSSRSQPESVMPLELLTFRGMGNCVIHRILRLHNDRMLRNRHASNSDTVLWLPNTPSLPEVSSCLTF